MKIAIILSLATLLAGGCVNPRPAPVAAPPDPPASIADRSVGLAPGSVFDAPSPPAVKANESAPGELPALPRPYAGAPPRIPHGVDDFSPITPKQNACLDCHGVKEKKAGDPTPIPASHYTDYRNAPDRVDARLVGARHVCISCHVATTDAPNLVENRFRP